MTLPLEQVDLNPRSSLLTALGPEQGQEELPVSYASAIVGAAVFDLSGLPRDYFTTTASLDAGWVQTIFQALGLQSLLVASLRLEGFRHSVVHGSDYWAIVVRQRTRYTALLVPRSELEQISPAFMEWAYEFDPTTLRSDARFQTL